MCARGHRSFKIGKRRTNKGAAGASQDRAAVQDRLQKQAMAPAPERRQANGYAAPPPGQRGPSSYTEPHASRDVDERRGSFDQQPWRHSHDGSVSRPRAVDNMAEESWSNTQGQRRPQQQAPSYDRGYDTGYDRGQQAPPPHGQAAPVPHMGGRGGAHVQPRYAGDYSRGPAVNVRADYPVGDYGAPARASQPGGGTNRRGGGSYNSDHSDDAFLGSILAEIQQQQGRRNPNQSNLQAAMASGYGPPAPADPNIYYSYR